MSEAAVEDPDEPVCERQEAVAPQVALLAAVHILVGFVWLTFYAWFVRACMRS